MAPRPSERERHDDSDSDSEQSSSSTGSYGESRTGKLSNSTRRSQHKKPRVGVPSVDITVDQVTQYAPLFGRWHFHSRVPLVRNLWKYNHYRFDQQQKLRQSGAVFNADSTSEPGGNRPGSSASSSWGENSYGSVESVRILDYPVHRARMAVVVFVLQNILRPVGLLPARFKDQKDGDHFGEDEGDDSSNDHEAAVVDSIRSSMEHSVVEGVEEDWGHVPRGPLRRRKQHLEQGKGGYGGVISGLAGWRRRDTDIATCNTPTGLDGGKESAATSVNVAVSVDEEDGMKGQGGGVFEFVIRKKPRRQGDVERGLASYLNI